MDAGGLAQMSYNNPKFNVAGGPGLGMPSSGFASRGKGSHNIKRLSVAPPSISTISETQNDALPTPRTSRSHLLAGLRTAPKSGTFPSTAPLAPTNNGMGGLEHSQWNNQTTRTNARQPQTSTGMSFPGSAPYETAAAGQPMYSMPEQVLAPPSIEISSEDGDGMDSKLYDELVATNLYLAEQQQRLQQQLINVTAAAQQFQGLNLYGNQNQYGNQAQYQQAYNPAAMNMMNNLYQQQLQQALQPIVQAVPNQPGLYSVFNPLTGQQTFVVDNAIQSQSPPPAYQETKEFPLHNQHHGNISPPTSRNSPVSSSRSRSPPKSISPTIKEEEVTPLPPPSANAFRRGHKKGLSSLNVQAGNNEAALKSALRTSMLPQTPVTGTFGPGQARAGEHPVRQPRGPPPMEELKEKPTAKHEGSKNFASRQRRRALNNLVQAGLGRRSGSNPGSSGSQTPASECELNFSTALDNSDLSGSGKLSHKNSLGSVGSAASRAIGSERKQRSSKNSHESLFTAASLSSEENSLGGKFVEVKTDDSQQAPERRAFARMLMSNAEKRRSFVN